MLDTHRYDESAERAAPPLPVSVVSATRRGAPNGRIRRWVGDGLVPVDSAEGVRVSRFALTRLHVNDAGHLGLLNHPAVRELLERQITADRDDPKI